MVLYGLNNAQGPLSCKQALQWKHFGEDNYMQICLKLLNAQITFKPLMEPGSCGLLEFRFPNGTKLNSSTWTPPGPDSRQLNYTVHPLPPQAPDCSIPYFPVYHSEKSVSGWQDCYTKTMVAENPMYGQQPPR